MKLCIDCKWHSEIHKENECTNPKMGWIDPVNGNLRINYGGRCSLLRNIDCAPRFFDRLCGDKFTCGPKGRFWEPKNE